MIPYKHQTEIADEALQILKDNAIVYLAMEERTGKTLTSILIAEASKCVNVLVLTKKKALVGWNDTLGKYGKSLDTPHKQISTFKVGVTKFTVTNYHQVNILPKSYDLVILDEAHNYLSAYPKTSKMWASVYKITKGKPIIYLSATPYAQGMQLLFNQFRLSSWSPFKHSNFYRWFDEFGISSMVKTPMGLKETYSKCKTEEVMKKVKHLFITKTRKELGFEHEPTDELHYVDLCSSTKDIYNTLMKESVVQIGDMDLVCDTPMKLRTSLHMLEGGVAKVDDVYYELPNSEKIDAIKKDLGDSKNLCIMYNYVAEGHKLRKFFKNALILQGTSNAEGVDLSNIENLCIYSQDFSTARHSQRRARQANKNRNTKITVHFYLVKGAVSEQVYNTVTLNKSNFIDSLFERKTL